MSQPNTYAAAPKTRTTSPMMTMRCQWIPFAGTGSAVATAPVTGRGSRGPGAAASSRSDDSPAAGPSDASGTGAPSTSAAAPARPAAAGWWAPARRLWWIAVLFGIGSTCFALGAAPAYVLLVGRAGDGITFFVGSLFFTSAALLQLLDSGPRPRSLRDRG